MSRNQLLCTLAATLALATLVFLPLPRAESETVLVLTDGASARIASEAGVAWSSREETIRIGGVSGAPRWAAPFADAGALARRYQPGQRLAVVGHGLDPWDVQRVDEAGLLVETWAAPPQEGVLERVTWRRDLALGQPLVLRGWVHPRRDSATTLHLVGPGSDVQQEIPAGTDLTPFRLELTPPATGAFVFELLRTIGEASESLGQVDVHVQDELPPSVLWLERAPSFETRHVKRWLATRSGELAIRSPVSRDRYRYEFHNMDRRDLSRLTEDRLEAFDLVVVDEPTWEDLVDAERSTLLALVREGELGIVLRLEPGVEGSSPEPFGVATRRVPDIEQLMVRAAAPGPPVEPLEMPPFELDSGDLAVQPLFRDGAGRTLALSRLLGRGAVALTTVRGSYRWELQGRRDVHRDYWSSLLEAVAPPDSGPRWLLPPGPVVSDRPFEVDLAAADGSDVTLIGPGGDVARVPMREHPTLTGRFSATLWPRETGWYTLRAAESESRFHATGAGNWREFQQAERRAATERLVARSGTRDISRPSAPLPWLRLAALAVLLLSLATAWIDERRSQS